MITLVLVLSILIGAWFLLERAGDVPVKSELLNGIGEAIRPAEEFRASHPGWAVGVFAAVHLLVSFLSLPGCTILNIASGYLFGFWKGSAVVYLITLASAALGFLAGRRFLGRTSLPKRLARLDWLHAEIEKRGGLYLVGLRLSPFIPFGLLNLALGATPLRFTAYMASTTVGIFFDVVLLNQVGHQLRGIHSPGFGGPGILVVFALLLALLASGRVFGRRVAVRAP